MKDLRTVIQQKETEIAQMHKEIEILRAALAILEDAPEMAKAAAAAAPFPLAKAVGANNSDVKMAQVISPVDAPKRAFIP